MNYSNRDMMRDSPSDDQSDSLYEDSHPTF
jgi:hypothetical protein